MAGRDERQALEAIRSKRRAKATLAQAKALLARREGRASVDYQIAGLQAELDDGLARLERADQADDHVADHRRVFGAAVRVLRRELDSPTPDIHALALAAMQASFLANIWPVLHAARQQWRGPHHFTSVNTTRQAAARDARTRCLALAQRYRTQSPAVIQRHHRVTFPKLRVPSDTSIRRYLKSPQK